MALKVPVNFVLPKEECWPQMAEGRWTEIDDDFLSQHCTTPVTYWINHTYIQFKRAGFDVTYSFSLKNKYVNIGEGTHIGVRARPFEPFLVTTRGDGHFPHLANYAIEQNGLRTSGRSAVITGWPQPGLVPRDQNRGSRLEVVAFKGTLNNLAEPYRSDVFRKQLGELGVELKLDTSTGIAPGAIRMHDYSDVDAVLAVRDLTEGDYATKPPNKVFNCWHAGVPALVGPEPAYAEVMRSKYDFVVVRSPDDVVRSIRQLKENPDLYMKFIAAGQARAPDYSREAILNRWVSALNGPVREAFEEWQRRSSLSKRARLLRAVVLEKMAKYNASKHRYRGRRGPGTANLPGLHALDYQNGG